MKQYAYESANASFSWADVHINCGMIGANTDVQSASRHESDDENMSVIPSSASKPLHTWCVGLATNPLKHLSNETACVRDTTKIKLITVK